MKGINVRKLAAIATGAALLGSAVAPIVSAASVQKSDIYNADGTPKVNIVVGSQAAVSDAIWAGNLAAKIAEKAATKKTVSVSGADGTSGSAAGKVDLSNLTVDVTVGGTVTVTAASGSKDTRVYPDSRAGGYSVWTANDTNVLTSGQVSSLYNSTLTEKVNQGNQLNQTTTPTVQEKLGVTAQAKFDSSDTSVKDFVTTIQPSNFYYQMTIGTSTSGLNLGSTSFTAGNTDSVKLVLFGQQYQLSTANISTSSVKNLTLIKSSAKETYTEGQQIQGLLGGAGYNGQSVTVKFTQISATSSTAVYTATFGLYDSQGNLIDTETVSSGANLRDQFKDRAGNNPLQSNLFVNTIAVAPTTNLGYIEVTKGTNTLVLYDGKGFPYDSTDTNASHPYTVSISNSSGGTADANSLYSIKISNQLDYWDTGGFGPLYPAGNLSDGSTQKLTSKTGVTDTATFGQSLPAGTLGKGFATVQFLGWVDTSSRTVIKLGKSSDITSKLNSNASGANGGINYADVGGGQHYIPFYIERQASATTTDVTDSFTYDGQTIWYDINYGPSNTAFDYNLIVNNGDYVNGRKWTITSVTAAGGSDSNDNITIGPAGGVFSGTALNIGALFTVDGVTYKLTDTNYNHTGIGLNGVGVAVDGVMTFRQNSSTGTLIYNADANGSSSTTYPAYGHLFFTRNTVFDGNGSGNGVSSSNQQYNTSLGLVGAQSKKNFYAVYPYATNNKVFFLLSAGTLNPDDGSSGVGLMQYNKVLQFLGTNYPTDSAYTEVKGMGFDFVNASGNNGNLSKAGSSTSNWVPYYLPHTADINAGSAFTASGAYFVAEFVHRALVSNGDFNMYINTGTGGTLGDLTSNNQLTGYNTNTDFNGTPSWSLTQGTSSSFLQAGYTDAGAKAWLQGTDDAIVLSLPQVAEQVDVLVAGQGQTTTTTTTGGSPLTGIKVGSSASTTGGTTVTVNAVNGAACKVDQNAGTAGTCAATPNTYWAQAGVKNPIVFVDTDNPTGSNVVVGGNIVNKLASSLANRLTAPGQTVMEVDSATGTIYAAGYTADDTVSAVKSLIAAVDSWTGQ